MSDDCLNIGIVSISDRASQGIYQDAGVPALESWLQTAMATPYRVMSRLIADEAATITATLVELIDEERCHLVLTTGGTGPSRRDVTPEATLAAGTREMPGFAEQMRQISLRFVPTAILSRQTAVLREIDGHAALILNLPGQPKSIKETLEGVRGAAGESLVPGIFAAIPYCLDLIGAPYIDTILWSLLRFDRKAHNDPPLHHLTESNDSRDHRERNRHKTHRECDLAAWPGRRRQ